MCMLSTHHAGAHSVVHLWDPLIADVTIQFVGGCLPLEGSHRYLQIHMYIFHYIYICIYIDTHRQVGELHKCGMV